VIFVPCLSPQHTTTRANTPALVADCLSRKLAPKPSTKGFSLFFDWRRTPATTQGARSRSNARKNLSTKGRRSAGGWQKKSEAERKIG
jgi:hypothetical protein